MPTTSIYTDEPEQQQETAPDRADLLLAMIGVSPDDIPFQPIHYLIEPEIRDKSLHLVTGESGHGKSYLLLKWGIDIAKTGKDVLYLDRENTIEDIQLRIQRFGKLPPSFKYWGGWHTIEAPTVDSSDLRAVVERMNNPVIIVDACASFKEGVENSNDDIHVFFKPLRRFVHGGCTAIVAHNTGKNSPDPWRGAQAFKDAVDVGLQVVSTLDKLGNIECMKVTSFKRRNGGMEEQVYSMLNGVLIRQTPESAVRSLESWFESNQGHTLQELQKLAKDQLGVTRVIVRNFVNDRLVAHQIERRDGGLYLTTIKQGTCHL